MFFEEEFLSEFFRSCDYRLVTAGDWTPSQDKRRKQIEIEPKTGITLIGKPISKVEVIADLVISSQSAGSETFGWIT